MYTKIAAVAALASLVAAAPTNVVSQRDVQKGFSVKQVATGNKVHRNGARDYARALKKYNVAVPSGVQVAAAQQTGSVAANPEEGDSEYVCPVSFGSGSQLSLDFDTGSADLWVFGSSLPSSTTSGHSVYSPDSQPLSGYSWSISYGDGSGASGDVYQDSVIIGGVTATQQAVEVATSLTASQEEPTPFAGSDGLVGLAFSSINTVKPQAQSTFFDTVSGSLPSQLFTATLKSGEAGSYDFGYIDNSKYSGSIAYASVDNSNGFWQFTTDGASAGGQSLASGFSAIADTGTTLILLDDDLISNYYSQIDGAQNSQQQGGYIFPCSSSAPDFVVSIGGQDATVPGSYIAFQNIDGTNCYGGIQSNSGIGFSILGDVFLKSQFVVFDASGPQVGFAAQA